MKTAYNAKIHRSTAVLSCPLEALGLGLLGGLPVAGVPGAGGAEGDDDVMMLDEVNGLPVFDLILLGMGADGHVGSIYPDSDALKDETGAAVLGVDMPGKRSITMSLPLINTAERVVVAASGTKKAETVRAVLEDDESELPGACVDAFSTIFFLDSGAASKLVAYAEEEEEE